MTQKELQKLNRKQLLELLLAQTERADQLQKKLHSLETQLRQQEGTADYADPAANTPMQLSRIFEAAKTAADIYLESIRKQEALCAQMEEAAKLRAEAIIQEAEQRSAQIQEEAEAHRLQSEQLIKEYFLLMDDLHHKETE